MSITKEITFFLDITAFSGNITLVVINRCSRHSTGIVVITRAFNVKSHCTPTMLKSKLINFFF